jgi:hypothetical protein
MTAREGRPDLWRSQNMIERRGGEVHRWRCLWPKRGRAAAQHRRVRSVFSCREVGRFCPFNCGIPGKWIRHNRTGKTHRGTRRDQKKTGKKRSSVFCCSSCVCEMRVGHVQEARVDRRVRDGPMSHGNLIASGAQMGVGKDYASNRTR